MEVNTESPSTPLIPRPPSNNPRTPKDTLQFAYIIFFTLGTGYGVPFNAFINAVDYFSYLYPNASVDRVFAIVYMVLAMLCVIIMVALAQRLSSFWSINLGLALFLGSLIVVPLIDVFWVKGVPGLYGGFYVTVGLAGLAGIASGFVQMGVIGSAGELPERYMQAVVAGTAASGVLVSLLRILTKAIYPQDAHGLRKSANLYFIVGIAVMFVCVIFYSVAHRLPVINYYNDLKRQAINEEQEGKGDLATELPRPNLWDVVGTVKWHGCGIIMIYSVTLSIFPGFVEDVHSQMLRDWYPIILIMSFSLFDLLGKSLTALYLLENATAAICASFARLLFVPLYYGCLHGPKLFRTEIPVTILTCLLGLTNGYLTSVLMILAPKSVTLLRSETAGMLLVLFLVIGMAIGSIVSWFWVI